MDKMLQPDYTFSKEDISNVELLANIIVNYNVKAFKQLLQLGLDTETVIPFFYDGTVQNLPLLHAAVKALHIKLVKLLLHYGANINKRDELGQTVLFHISKNRRDIIQKLLDHGVDINAELEDGTHALHYAAKCGCNRLLVMLLNSKANINQRTKTGMTPLHVVSIYNNSQAIRLLTKRGADIDARTDKNFTALHFSLMYKHWACTMYLLDYKLNLNVQDNFGRTPAHIAASLGMPHVVRCLLLHGANITMEDKEGRTPYMIATKLVNKRMNPYQLINEEMHRYFYIQDLYGSISYDKVMRLFSLKYIDFRNHKNKFVFRNDLLEIFDNVIELMKNMNRYLKMNKKELQQLLNSKWTNIPNGQMSNFELLQEVKIIRNSVIGKGVTIYDILTRNFKEVAKYFNDQYIAAKLLAFEKKFLKEEKFCYYRYLVQKQIDAAEWYYLKKLAEKNFILVFKNKLPDLVILEILSYFSKNDLKIFLQVKKSDTK